jgi:hypothetical protein
LSFCRIIALISGGLYCLPPAVDARVAVRAADDLVRDDRLLLAHLGLLAAHEALDREDGVLRIGDRLALGDGADEAVAVLREGDHDGVVRPPSTFSMTVGSPPSRTAMHEFVVPRSIPMVLAMW